MKTVILEIIPEDEKILEVSNQEYIPSVGDSIMVVKDPGVAIQNVTSRQFRYKDNELVRIVIHTEKTKF